MRLCSSGGPSPSIITEPRVLASQSRPSIDDGRKSHIDQVFIAGLESEEDGVTLRVRLAEQDLIIDPVVAKVALHDRRLARHSSEGESHDLR